MTEPAASALDKDARSELKRYSDRAKRLLLGAAVALVTLMIVGSLVDVGRFQGLVGTVVAVNGVVLGTAVGSLRRATAQEEILRSAVWHRHKCEYAPRGVMTNAGVILHHGAVLTLRTGVTWRIGKGGLPAASHVQVADGGGVDVVFRVPGKHLLFTAGVGPPGVSRPL